MRWIEGYERLAEAGRRTADTRLVYVADRESDMIGLMVAAHEFGTPADWLIRSRHMIARCQMEAKLWASAGEGEPIGEIHVYDGLAPWRESASGTSARVAAPHQPARGRRSQRYRDLPDRTRVRRTGWCEAHRMAPADQSRGDEFAAGDRVDRLVSGPLGNRDVLFNVLKNGCRVEALQLGTIERLERALALFLVVAWRIV